MQLVFLLLLVCVGLGASKPTGKCRRYLLNSAWMPNLRHVPNPCYNDNDTSECSQRIMWMFEYENPANNSITMHTKFYEDFRTNLQWSSKFCRMDSDGDGMTNGEELGDALCNWNKTMSPDLPNKPTSHPAICEPVNSDLCLNVVNGFRCPLSSPNRDRYTGPDPLHHAEHLTEEEEGQDGMVEDFYSTPFVGSQAHQTTGPEFVPYIKTQDTAPETQNISLSSTPSLEMITQFCNDSIDKVDICANKSMKTLSKEIIQECADFIYNEILKACPDRLASFKEKYQQNDQEQLITRLSLTTPVSNPTWRQVNCSHLFEIFYQRGCKLDFLKKFLEQPYFDEKVIECWPVISDKNTNQCPFVSEYLYQNIPDISTVTSNIGQPTIEDVFKVDNHSIEAKESRIGLDLSTIEIDPRNNSLFAVLKKYFEVEYKARFGLSHNHDVVNSIKYRLLVDMISIIEKLNYTLFTENNFREMYYSELKNTTNAINDQVEFTFLVIDKYFIKIEQDRIANYYNDSRVFEYLYILNEISNSISELEYVISEQEKYYPLEKHDSKSGYFIKTIFEMINVLKRRIESIKLNLIQYINVNKLTTAIIALNSKTNIDVWDQFLNSLYEMRKAAELRSKNSTAFNDVVESQNFECLKVSREIMFLDCNEVNHMFQNKSFIEFAIESTECWVTIIHEVDDICNEKKFDFNIKAESYNQYREDLFKMLSTRATNYQKSQTEFGLNPKFIDIRQSNSLPIVETTVSEPKLQTSNVYKDKYSYNTIPHLFENESEPEILLHIPNMPVDYESEINEYDYNNTEDGSMTNENIEVSLVQNASHSNNNSFAIQPKFIQFERNASTVHNQDNQVNMSLVTINIVTPPITELVETPGMDAKLDAHITFTTKASTAFNTHPVSESDAFPKYCFCGRQAFFITMVVVGKFFFVV